ncbi:hypothetical protein [Gordonia spumicola]|nr:hypothetical protein [Gordonia spumicola]
MNTIAQRGREQWIADLCLHIADRAETAGWMVAVRHAGDSVTFDALVVAINDYRRVVGAHGMSSESAITAALCASLPGLLALPPAEQARALAEIIGWLGRDVPQTTVGRPALRSVS